MDKTRNKKRSRRKSRKITGGMDAAVLTKNGDILHKSSWTTIKSLDDLDEYSVKYNNVTYEIIKNRTQNTMTWSNINDEKGTLFKVISGNLKRKKWLIGDAISQIYGVKPGLFDDFVSGVAVVNSTEKGENINSDKITSVQFSPKTITIYYSRTIVRENGETQIEDNLSKYITINDITDKYQTAAFGNAAKPWENKVLDYYLQTINQTTNISELGRPAGIVKRAATKLITGKSMDAQLLEQKAKRVPILTEIQEAFGTIKEGVYDAKSGELTFKATILTDGEGGYVVTDIKVANEVGEV